MDTYYNKKINWDGGTAEQAYLNSYYKNMMLTLPPKYNLNTDLPVAECHEWIKLLKTAKLIHMTMYKPFEYDHNLQQFSLINVEEAKAITNWSPQRVIGYPI